MPAKLSSNQKKLLIRLCQFVDAKGYAPSLRELCFITGLASTKAVSDNLNTLQECGYIEREPRGARSIRILKRQEDEDELVQNQSGSGGDPPT